MPRPAIPLTPAASTEIAGKEGYSLANVDALALPPSAVSGKAQLRLDANAPSTSSQLYAPIVQQSAPSRKRTSTHVDAPAFDGSIPPPPSRSRKIIQVEPKQQAAKKVARVQDANMNGAPIAAAKSLGSRKKGTGTTAGRKIARKTAHSLIERRRRSKMNEEFGVLKDMIPACHGEDMHKLAILQASIEYVRYLKKCIVDLQSGQLDSPGSSTLSPRTEAMQQPMSRLVEEDSGDEYDDDGKEDAEDDDEQRHEQRFERPSHRTHSVPSGPSLAIASPIPSANSTYKPSFAHGDLPSPALGPRDADRFTFGHDPSFPPLAHQSPPHSTNASPDILPQSRGSNSEEEDASQALLMLNACDRRSSVANDTKPDREWVPGSRGMSVHDLLR